MALIAAAGAFARADDYGPRGDIREVRFAAQRLLAHSLRGFQRDPQTTEIRDVVSVDNQAVLSWRNGPAHGLMGLVRLGNRWWDALEKTSFSPENSAGAPACSWQTVVAYPLPPYRDDQDTTPPSSAMLANYGMTQELAGAASLHNADVARGNAQRARSAAESNPPRIGCVINIEHGWPHISGAGGFAFAPRASLSGYELRIQFTNTDAAGDIVPALYARAPTPAEIIPYPTTSHFVATAVLYFDLTIDGSAPVTFEPGTTVDVWFPFVLDDTLKYDLTIGFARQPIGPVYAKPFDNALHYRLPGFTASPGQTLMAEIDGNWP